ncbi:hypothetical protein [Sphingomonas mollis]|uniref:Tyr recombinase domain-containing protein n=1 Tax=Sphingomonas mollis TaxID=2795726 RepID=A0ABS0XLK2_9SPHN|nr:hypothetical protein [Sphingomonas sp. BT553]MBJ6120902.1 hypothetical protein [Sphingomonas sp. BT553]
MRLFEFAVKARMRPNNPVTQSEKIKDTAADRTKGFHSWTEAEIDQYRDRHPIGTRARLAMEMLLWTTKRRSDVRQMGPDAIVDGRIEVTQGKGGKTLWIAVAPQLLEALTAMPPPPAGATTFLLTERGQPWSRAGFGNWFRKQCDAAGLS